MANNTDSEKDSFIDRLKKAKDIGKSESVKGRTDPGEQSSLSNSEAQFLEKEASTEDGEFYRFRLSIASSNSRIRESEARIMAVKVKHHEQNLDMRAKYASKAYRFVWLWSIALIVILVLQGSSAPAIKIFFIHITAQNFKLDDKVVIALISGVTVNIVAVFVVVIRNLFPSEDKEPTESTKKEPDKKDEEKS